MMGVLYGAVRGRKGYDVVRGTEGKRGESGAGSGTGGLGEGRSG